MIRACIFDMDGTVLDTVETICYFVNETLAKYGARGISVDECRLFVGNGARRLIERAVASRGIAPTLIPQIIDEYNVAYAANPTYLTRPYDDVCELIAALRHRGISVGIASNKPHFVTRPLAEHFFGDSVGAVLGARDGVPLKPDPSAARAVLEALGASPTECAYIGDTGVDMQTGKNLGATLVVGVSWGFREREELAANGADVIVNEPLQILREVARID